MNSPTFTSTLEILEKHNQSHLLAFYHSLSATEQASLLDQILKIDWENISRLVNNLLLSDKSTIEPSKISPPTHVVHAASIDINTKNAWEKHGLELLAQNKVACLTVAGGEGSRLGHNGPKGTLELPLNPPKTLFMLMAQRLVSLRKKTGGSIPWYIMTSPSNHKATVDYFEKQMYMGLPKSDVFFFSQAQMPALSTDGKVLLANKAKLALSPNGNGGVFSSLLQSGGLADMQKRGIEQVFFCTVDNALVKMADPVFVGYTSSGKFPAACKTVRKAHAGEKVGVFALYQNRPIVVEYSDLPDALKTSVQPSGELMYAEGNTAIHCFEFNFLKKLANATLEYHRAFKKIATLDKNGEPIQPTEPNGYKFELFMFDGFALAEKMGLFSVAREQEFAPIKNPTGDDSPESAMRMLDKAGVCT